METGILSDVKAKKCKSARQTRMHISIYATSNDTSNILTPLLSRFIKLKLPEYDLEIFTEIRTGNLVIVIVYMTVWVIVSFKTFRL